MDLIKIFEGNHKRTPCWFMRQAGRYLPEYRKLRESCPDFIEFCMTPDLITEATLQPLRRYDLDAGIIFSDILVLPNLVGQKVWFEQNHGPRLEPYRDDLNWNVSFETLSPVYEGIRNVKAEMASDKALIGFAGAPYTLACYMIEGTTTRTFSKAKTWGFQNLEKMDQLLDNLSTKIVEHLRNQIEAGCDLVQIFDSWAASVPEAYVERWLIKPMAKIVKDLKASHPDAPIIAFPKDLGGWIPEYVKGTDVDAISLSSSEKLSALLPLIPDHVAVQGALDPQLLVAGGAPMREEIERKVKLLKGRRHVFNLGHGIVPETPPEHVGEALKIFRDAEAS